MLDPIALSGLDDKGVLASYFLEREEVEVGEVVAWEVEVVSNPSVPVVGHSAPVLSASLSTRSCVSHFPHILSRFPLAGSRPMRAGDGIADIGVVAGDVLLDRPGLACQGAGVCPAVGGVDAAQAPQLATLLEP